MRMLPTVTLAAALAPTWASALDVHPEVAARSWFVSAHGEVQRTDLDTLDFDRGEGQSEFRVGAQIGERHHLNVSYLRIRREEQGLATGSILGLIQFQDPLSIDVSADYVRMHYGYSIVHQPWFDVQPFLEVGVLHESTRVSEELLGQTSRQRETIPVPVPGIAAELAPEFPVHARAQVGGIAVPDGHLFDVEGAAEADVGFVFAAIGYRYADVVVDTDAIDVNLKGLFLEGGLRF